MFTIYGHIFYSTIQSDQKNYEVALTFFFIFITGSIERELFKNVSLLQLKDMSIY